MATAARPGLRTRAHVWTTVQLALAHVNVHLDAELAAERDPGERLHVHKRLQGPVQHFVTVGAMRHLGPGIVHAVKEKAGRNDRRRLAVLRRREGVRAGEQAGPLVACVRGWWPGW